MDADKSFVLSQRTADEMEVLEGDIFARATGDSMKGAGILDGFVVAVRPYRNGAAPRRGDIVFMEVNLDGEEPEYTLKEWVAEGRPGVPPKLIDGNGEPFELPEGAEPRPIGRAVAVVGKLI